MKYLHLSLCVAMLFLLTACPYSSEFPLDNPTKKINQDFLGKWVEQGGSDEKNPSFFVISDLGNNTYQFEKSEYNSSQETFDKTIFTGYLTEVGKTPFLNLKKQDDANFLFYKIQLAKDSKSFVLFEVTDNIDEKFSNSKEVKAFFEKYKDLSFFYNKDEKTYNKQ